LAGEAPAEKECAAAEVIERAQISAIGRSLNRLYLVFGIFDISNGAMDDDRI
jgi:hypothetical protein